MVGAKVTICRGRNQRIFPVLHTQHCVAFFAYYNRVIPKSLNTLTVFLNHLVAAHFQVLTLGVLSENMSFFIGIIPQSMRRVPRQYAKWPSFTHSNIAGAPKIILQAKKRCGKCFGVAIFKKISPRSCERQTSTLPSSPLQSDQRLGAVEMNPRVS